MECIKRLTCASFHKDVLSQSLLTLDTNERDRSSPLKVAGSMGTTHDTCRALARARPLDSRVSALLTPHDFERIDSSADVDTNNFDIKYFIFCFANYMAYNLTIFINETPHEQRMR